MNEKTRVKSENEIQYTIFEIVFLNQLKRK